MSDWYEALVDLHATSDSAGELATKAVEALTQYGIIDSRMNSECVLGGEGYSPGPSLPLIYLRGENEGRFWQMRTSGLEVTVGRWFNMFGTTVLEWIKCPHCEAKFQLEDTFGDHFAEQVGRWLDEKPTVPIRCEHCEAITNIEAWQSNPHLGFSMLTFQFWNWPPLDSSSWQVDIADFLSNALGHELVRTWGRV